MADQQPSQNQGQQAPQGGSGNTPQATSIQNLDAATLLQLAGQQQYVEAAAAITPQTFTREQQGKS